MPVFISYKRADQQAAFRIYGYLQANQVQCYIDQADAELQTTDDLTAMLMRRVRECTHIMAIVSGFTQQSWWVPFEIGVASELRRRVTSYELAQTKLPDFLSKWPVLRTYRDLDHFIYAYKRDDAIVRFAEAAFDSALESPAALFHAELKRALGQR